MKPKEKPLSDDLTAFYREVGSKALERIAEKYPEAREILGERAGEEEEDDD